MITWLDTPDTPFPPTSQALGPESEAPGLLAAGGSLSISRLRSAYERGIFPWYSAGQPPLWWSTSPRMVLQTDEFKVSRSLKKTLKGFINNERAEIRIDSAFAQVISACANTPRSGQNGTWIVEDIQAAYRAWHQAGQVHSFETWLDGELIGGLYGVSIGRMFYGESMFSHRSDASKIALSALVAFCRSQDIPMIDCQQNTPHLASLGARPLPRDDFESHLSKVIHLNPVEAWHFNPELWQYLRLRSTD